LNFAHTPISKLTGALSKLRIVAGRGAMWHHLQRLKLGVQRLYSRITSRAELLAKLRTFAEGRREAAARLALRVNSDARPFVMRAMKTIRRGVALLYRRANLLRYGFKRRMIARRRILVILVLLMLVVASAILVLPFRQSAETYFSAERLSFLRNMLATIGGALVGATAIGFSVVMIAVQLNFARMPHGLFRKLSSDVQLLGAFAATFILAIAVAALSLMPDASWSVEALLVATWSTALILVLFLYGYRRALDLINPIVQLRLIVASAQKDMRRWVRGARRMAPLLELPDAEEQTHSPYSTHDMPRAAYFQANPHWTAVSTQAIAHAVSFARRYAEQGDYEVSSSALNAILLINASYLDAKGKTFFAHNPVFDIPWATDGFVNDTLEQLRQLGHIATARADEEQIRQILAALAGLVQVYMAIDYANEHVDNKEHAQLAASYLTGAVESALARNMTDVVMEGVRLMGRSAQRFLAASSPNDIVTLAEKIAAFSCTGAVKPELRAVTLTGMEQLARLTFDLLRTKAHDINFAVSQLRGDIQLVVQMFLNVPDAPLTNTHGTFLAPYYSMSKTQTFGGWLTDLVNTLVEARADDEDAKAIIRNIETWAEELSQTEKKLLLLAIEKRSHFTFDVLHWIAHMTKLLVAVSNAPATDDHTKEELQRHADWLISVLSWIPDDKDVAGFVENLSFTELLFEAALDAMSRESYKVAATTRNLLISWAFKGGHHETGRGILGRALIASVTVALWKEQPNLVPWLKAEIVKRLAAQEAPSQEMRDRAARELRRQAVTFRRREFDLSRINNAMAQIEPAKLRPLLNEVADLLSPATAAEPANAEIL
jgi:hypothetical protein